MCDEIRQEDERSGEVNYEKNGYLLISAAIILLVFAVIEMKGCSNNNDCYHAANEMKSVEALKICAEQDRWSEK